MPAHLENSAVATGLEKVNVHSNPKEGQCQRMLKLLHKAFDCVDHNKLWKILKKTEIPDHLTCLLRNLYAGQKAAVGTGHRTTDWFQIGIVQGCILSPCLFKLHTECVMWNAGLDERIKIAGRNINNLRYADDTTLMAENEEELKSLWWKWKRRVKKLA